MSVRADYGEAYFQKCRSYEDQEIALRINAGRISMVNRHFGPLAVLDIGVGSGEFIKKRPNTYGFDVNPTAMEWLKGSGLWCDELQKFRAFTMWDVIEHVPDPGAYFSRMQFGSFLFTSIPIFNDLTKIRESKHYRPGEHLYYFSERGLVDWLRNYGFLMLERDRFEIDAGRDSIFSFAFQRVWA